MFRINLFKKTLILLITILTMASCDDKSSKSNEKLVSFDLDELIIKSKNLTNEQDVTVLEQEFDLLKSKYADSLFDNLGNKKELISNAINEAKTLNYISLINSKGVFANANSRYTQSFYGLSKDSIKIKFDADKRIKRLIVVEDQSGRELENIISSKFDFVFDVYFDNPFSVIIEFNEESYFNLSILRKPASIKNKFAVCEISTDTLYVDRKTKGYEEGKKLNYQKVFNEPKKFVVSKSFSLSGESKVYAPIELPNKTVEFIYTLRISGDTEKLSEDGTLYNQVDKSYKKIKTFGVPIWESEGNSTSITREILNSIFKPKVDHYALNVFFFDKEKEIKKFVNYTGSDYASAFAYDINNSAISSESRVGLVKKPKSGYYYIGLQTTSTFSDTYAWLDVIALYETKYYYKLRRKLIRK